MSDSFYVGPGVVLRPGELFLKGKNRHIFEEALERNVRRAIKDRSDLQLRRKHGRIFITGASDTDLLSRLRWVFGVSSFSPVVFCEKDMDRITGLAVEMGVDSRPSTDDTFRISARRSDKSFNHNSTEIGRIAGAAVAVRTQMGVDLEKPDLEIGVEVGKSWCFLWTRRIPGGGGLPVGTSGRTALLLSGGIDSPVAGHLLQKRGLEVTGVYFHAYPYTRDGAKDKVVDLARILAGRQKSMKLYVVPFAKIQEATRDAGSATYLVLIYRRMMVRIAERIAATEKIKALATGENLGQVASQTIENMAVVEKVATMPMLRPLVCFDKNETIDLARQIGTYDVSIIPHDDCCTLFVPKHPQTKGTVHMAEKIEKRIEWEPLIEDAIENTEIIEL